MCVCVRGGGAGGGGCTRARACVCRSVCVCAFMLYALNFDNNYVLVKTCKRLGPERVRHSKYSLLLLACKPFPVTRVSSGNDVMRSVFVSVH